MEAVKDAPGVYFSDFALSEMVYLVHHPDQHQRMIICVLHRNSGAVTYELAHGTTCSWHAGAELSRERDNLKAANEKEN